MATVYITMTGIVSVAAKPKPPFAEVAHGFAAGVMMGAVQRTAQMSDDGRSWVVPAVRDAVSTGIAQAEIMAYRQRFHREINRHFETRRRA